VEGERLPRFGEREKYEAPDPGTEHRRGTWKQASKRGVRSDKHFDKLERHEHDHHLRQHALELVQPGTAPHVKQKLRLHMVAHKHAVDAVKVEERARMRAQAEQMGLFG